jgi:hypothetical protein
MTRLKKTADKNFEKFFCTFLKKTILSLFYNKHFICQQFILYKKNTNQETIKIIT